MDIEFWKIGLLFAAGVVSGWINVLAGGGSILSVPVMVFLGLPGPVANGTNRIGIIAQNFFAVLGFFRNGLSDFRLSATLAACASFGAFFGAMLGAQLDGVWFERTLAVIMLVVVGIMMTGAGQKKVVTDGEGAQSRVGALPDGRSRVLGRFYPDWRRLYPDADPEPRHGPRSGAHEYAQGFYRACLLGCGAFCLRQSG